MQSPFLRRGRVPFIPVAAVMLLLPVSAQSAFGAARQADFNGDGFADLAIGIPGESISGQSNAGAVTIIYGSGNGLSTTGDQFWSQDASSILESAEQNDGFGHALAAGDFNNDGFSDLAIGVPFENVSGVADAGAVHVLYGSASGLRSNNDELWHRNVNGIVGDLQTDARFGAALAVGDFDGDGDDDLAIGVPGQDVNGQDAAGEVHILLGSANGLSAGGDELWNQDSDEVEDDAEFGDEFGATLAAGDFDGDDRDDLAIGVPFEDEETGTIQDDAGMVQVLYGFGGGLTADDNVDFFQGEDGIRNDAEDDDNFGLTLAVGDFNNDGRDDLAVGIPGEDHSEDNAGAVAVLYGSSSGLSGNGDQFWNQDSSGITNQEHLNDGFGSSLAAGDFNNDGSDDLAIGVPQEAVGINVSAGAVHVLLGSPGKLNTINSQFWTQASPSIRDTTQDFDFFGSALTAGDYNSDGRDDLAIGVPNEDVNGIQNMGLIHIIYGKGAGLNAAGNQVWHQNINGINNDGQADERFGNSAR